MIEGRERGCDQFSSLIALQNRGQTVLQIALKQLPCRTYLMPSHTIESWAIFHSDSGQVHAYLASISRSLCLFLRPSNGNYPFGTWQHKWQHKNTDHTTITLLLNSGFTQIKLFIFFGHSIGWEIQMLCFQCCKVAVAAGNSTVLRRNQYVLNHLRRRKQEQWRFV